MHAVFDHRHAFTMAHDDGENHAHNHEYGNRKRREERLNPAHCYLATF
jgi:hypothetical protein